MLKRIGYSFLSKGIVAAVNFCVLLVSARYLGVRTRGDISLFLLNIALVQFVAEIFTGNNLIYLLKKFNNTHIFFRGVLFSLAMSIVGATIITQILNQPELGFLKYTTVLLPVFLHSFFCVFILANNGMRSYNIIALLQPLLLLVILAVQIWVLHQFVFTAYYYSVLISFLLALPFSAGIVVKGLNKDDNSEKANIYRLLINGSYIQLAAAMVFFMNRYSFYLFDENAKVGLYSTASSLMDALMLFANATVPVILAMMAKQQMQAKDIVTIINRLLLILCLLVFILVILPEKSITFLLGDAYTGIKRVMLAYAPSVLLQCVGIVLTQFFVARGKQLTVLLAFLPAFILVVFAAPYLISQFGYAGAAAISGGGFALALAILVHHFRIEVKQLQ